MIDWNKPRYLDLPDLRMAIFEAGQPHETRPAIVLCHGWPELAYSWRHIVAPLVEAGFHVIIPDQRGYGFTGNATNDSGDGDGVPLYDMQHLCDDMAHLLDALGITQAVFAGHDWGGIVIWQLPFYHASRVAGLIGVNTPFVPRLPIDPIGAMRFTFGNDFYIVTFQDYGRAEAVMDANVAHTLNCLYRTSRPDGAKSEPAPEHAKMWEKVELLNILQLDESSFPGAPLFNKEDFAYYEAAFARTGFRGGINWYRNFSHNWKMSKDFEQKINVPSLMICAENDRVLPPSMAEKMPDHIADLETHIIADCGHWTQNEKPEDLSALMCDWLTRRFG